jgi:hypothetical protein
VHLIELDRVPIVMAGMNIMRCRKSLVGSFGPLFSLAGNVRPRQVILNRWHTLVSRSLEHTASMPLERVRCNDVGERFVLCSPGTLL